MPFPGVDPWRLQYFAGASCPEHVVVPVDDAAAWLAHPAQRWVYNKLRIAETQGLPHGPHGVEPLSFPIFSKPIYNMRGMGTGSRIVLDAEEYAGALQPGHMWMKLLSGAHVSSDFAVLRGRPVWWRHCTGAPGEKGMFDYWTLHAQSMPTLEERLEQWIERHLDGFTGIVNFETIGECIIEVHLRMSEQWLDLNGRGWLAAVVRLYADERWDWTEPPRRTGYSVALFGAHGVKWQIDPDAVDELRRVPGVSSIQITFEPDRPPERHAMPPGGFRLAIVNCWDLDTGREVRAELARLFDAAGAPSKRKPGRRGRQAAGAQA
jgi:hypothetical protein